MSTQSLYGMNTDRQWCWHYAADEKANCITSKDLIK